MLMIWLLTSCLRFRVIFATLRPCCGFDFCGVIFCHWNVVMATLLVVDPRANLACQCQRRTQRRLWVVQAEQSLLLPAASFMGGRRCYRTSSCWLGRNCLSVEVWLKEPNCAFCLASFSRSSRNTTWKNYEQASVGSPSSGGKWG